MTAPYGDADIAFMLGDIGVPVSAGGVNAYGALDKADKLIVQDAKRGEIVATVPSVTVQVSPFPATAIAIDAPITVDGVNYYVREHDATGDGAVKKLYLRKA